jgi:hypothetical protein
MKTIYRTIPVTFGALALPIADHADIQGTAAAASTPTRPNSLYSASGLIASPWQRVANFSPSSGSVPSEKKLVIAIAAKESAHSDRICSK